MGRNDREGNEYSLKMKDQIVEYGEQDSNLTARLAWLKVKQFEDVGVRMVKPFSCASVAERSAYDSCNIPTMNQLFEASPDLLRAFWTAYQGGWFEATGSGRWDRAQAFDIVSAYPHGMWFLPDITDGTWLGTFHGSDRKEWRKRLHESKSYVPSVFEAEVVFPKGRSIYPASKTSEEFGCLTNARIVYGWFTGDEIKEFELWGAELHVERWAVFVPNSDNDPAEDVEDGIRYPFRPFVKKFYSMKLDQDKLRNEGSPEYDEGARFVAKTCINSLYGKTVQAIERDELKRTGQMWSSIYGATITAGTRMRLASFIRVNGFEGVLSVATDGIIMDGNIGGLIVPDNELPVFFDGERVNLGDWEDDGSGVLILMMSGVYSILKNLPNGNVDAKNTYRGTYALFIDRANENRYGGDWLEFTLRHKELEKVERTIEDNPSSRPFSLGEARVRKDFSLINKFRVVNVGISACGDSNKRRWTEKPKTFGDLNESWWTSHTWERSL